jgi:hypothetical protein
MRVPAKRANPTAGVAAAPAMLALWEWLLLAPADRE